MQEAGGTARLASRVNGEGAKFELRVLLKAGWATDEHR
jgi:hypothetical protein